MTIRLHGLTVLGQAFVYFGDPGALGAINLDQGKFVIVKLGDERNCPIDKVSKIIEQLGIVFELEIGPLEFGILNFRTHIKKVKTPHIGRDFSLTRLKYYRENSEPGKDRTVPLFDHKWKNGE